MTSSAAVTYSLRLRGAGCALLAAVLILPCGIGFAQTNSSKVGPVTLPLPISLEWSESLNPWAQSKLATDAFKLLAGAKSVKLQFSNQAPVILGGKQFQGLPGGYQLTEFSLARKWGTIYGFRSLGYSSRIVRPELARTITGAGVEAPNSIFGTRLSAYFLQATPTSQARHNSNSLIGSDGSQVGLTLARALGKGARLQAEWTQTHYSSHISPSANLTEFAGRAHRGYWLRLEGVLARTDLNLTCVTRDEGLANPAAPYFGPAKRTVWLDVRRKLKRHKFQYSGQVDDQRAAPTLGLTVRDVREGTFLWTYTPGHLPQISASQTWSRQTTAGKPEEEKTYRLALDKSFRRINASVAVFHGTRADVQSARPLWDRTVLAGDATVAIRKDQRLHIRYEENAMLQRTIAQRLSVSSLQFDTRFSLWGSKLSLAPAVDLRRQGGSSPAFDMSAARITLSATIKIPRRIPGTDLLINFASNHVSSMGRPDLNHAELTLRWNFKRM